MLKITASPEAQDKNGQTGISQKVLAWLLFSTIKAHISRTEICCKWYVFSMANLTKVQIFNSDAKIEFVDQVSSAIMIWTR